MQLRKTIRAPNKSMPNTKGNQFQRQIQRKMEWQAGTKIKSIWEGFIQIRPSGIRVKAPTCFPALVALVQIPIIGKYKRRLTVRECARLHSFPDSFIPSDNDQQAYKQFGNSVNVEIVKKLYDELMKY